MLNHGVKDKFVMVADYQTFTITIGIMIGAAILFVAAAAIIPVIVVTNRR